VLYYFIFLISFPLFFLYFFSCFIFPIIKFGKIKTGGKIKVYICKDAIHSDYVFCSKLFKDTFLPKKKFIKIGWGDRKIFLETKSWKNLKIKDLLFAFFGLNETVLRVDFLENIPEGSKFIDIELNQFNIIKKHIIDSFENKIIEKSPNFYEFGDFYKSNLKYNCVTNCNNWVNKGLFKAKASNRLWCPLSIYL
jgi:uncharacterized protein (TIGR02117 family)